MIKRLDTLDVATADLDQAGAVYHQNYGFRIDHAAGADDAVITIGDARIRLRSGAGAEAVLKSTGEGLAAIWLEADDVGPIQTALDAAGLKHHPLRHESDRRVLEMDPSAANLVPLFIFDRRA